MLAYMFFPIVALVIGAHTLRIAGEGRHGVRIYGASLVLVGLAMAGGLISAELATAAPFERSVVVSLR